MLTLDSDVPKSNPCGEDKDRCPRKSRKPTIFCPITLPRT